jgi:hypothetical protein
MNRMRILVLVLCMMAGLAYAQSPYYIQVTFKDQSNPNQTRDLVMKRAAELGITYVNRPAEEQQWVVQIYKDGGDGVISPLDPKTLLPTGDDVVAVTNEDTTQGAFFLTNTLWTIRSTKFFKDNATGNTFQGDMVYLRIFDASDIAKATQCITFKNLYKVPAVTALVDVSSQEYGWTDWEPIRKAED